MYYYKNKNKNISNIIIINIYFRKKKINLNKFLNYIKLKDIFKFSKEEKYNYLFFKKL